MNSSQQTRDETVQTDLNELVNEEYERKRRAVLGFTHGDVAKATEILDVDIELELPTMHLEWAESEFDVAADEQSKRFFAGLQDVLYDERRATGKVLIGVLGTLESETKKAKE